MLAFEFAGFYELGNDETKGKTLLPIHKPLDRTFLSPPLTQGTARLRVLEQAVDRGLVQLPPVPFHHLGELHFHSYFLCHSSLLC